ncbi:glycoside hydrolase N-terminal domain-containing protein [Streptomyces sp. NPDC053755]|uniref:glycosyl hydrolase family 95 catalytic domain-containing protein n=1 Tax=Streptomyces sp. NPDC053755 TaxID=3155815 RepID=UPI0034299D9A
MIHGTWEPQPARRWEDAFLSGNGRHGAMVLGDPDDDRVIITHHTLVRPHDDPEAARPPRLAARLAGLQDRLLAGDRTAAEDFTDGRPTHWVRAFHPAFQTRLTREPAGLPAAASVRRHVDFTSGVVTTDQDRRRSRVFVSRADDVVVQHVTEPGPAVELGLDHRLPGVPADLAIGRGATLTGHDAVLTLRAGYPRARHGYTGVVLLLTTGGRVSITTSGVRIEGARDILTLTRVRRHDEELDVAGEVADLRALLRRPDGAPARSRDRGRLWTGLLARHTALHTTAYGRVTLDLAAHPSERALPGSVLLRRPPGPALLERLFAAGRYHLLSSSGMLPPRLTGLWTGDWNTAWSGAFTTNANLNLQTSSAAAADLPEVTAAQSALIEGQLPDWRDNARTVFGARGVVAPSHTDGESGHSYHFSRAYPLHLWTAGADWLLKPLLDEEEGRGAHSPRLTALLDEVADFYEDFLTRTGPDGRIAVVPSYSPENRPANGSWGAVDATMDVCAARHALLAAADRAPGPRAARLRALADRLAPLRVNDDGALAEWARPGLDDRYDHRHLSHLYPVWPLEEINPYDTPALATAARRALELRGSENDAAHGHLHHALIAARLRDAGRVQTCLERLLTGDYFHDSLMSAHYPGRDVYNADAAHALPALLVESLVQSTPGRLVLLPAPPAACPSGRLTGIRTRCGVRVGLEWAPGTYTAVLRPTRTVRIDLRTPDGSATLDLAEGEERVVTARDGERGPSCPAR